MKVESGRGEQAIIKANSCGMQGDEKQRASEIRCSSFLECMSSHWEAEVGEAIREYVRAAYEAYLTAARALGDAAPP